MGNPRSAPAPIKCATRGVRVPEVSKNLSAESAAPAGERPEDRREASPASAVQCGVTANGRKDTQARGPVERIRGKPSRRPRRLRTKGESVSQSAVPPETAEARLRKSSAR